MTEIVDGARRPGRREPDRAGPDGGDASPATASSSARHWRRSAQQNRGGRGRAATTTRGDDIVTRSFNAHTHQWVLFFSSGGKVFREKVWRLPEAGPTAKGRALVNLLPELTPTQITTVLPLPQDETLWDSLHLVFATAQGNVRRNRLSDFRNVRATGLIAMKLDEGDRLIGVATCREGDRRAAGDAARPLHPLPDHRGHAARLRRPRFLGRARHQAVDGKARRGDQPFRAAAMSRRRPRSVPPICKEAAARRNGNGDDAAGGGRSADSR